MINPPASLPVLIFTGFIAVAYGFGVYLFPAISPSIRPDLGFQFSALGDIASAQQFGFLAGCVLVGDAVAEFGAGRVILAALGTGALCLLGMAAVQRVWILAALLIALNSTAVFIWAPMVSVVAHYVPDRHRGKALGLIASGTSYGVLANGLLLAPLAVRYSWRATWAAAGLLAGALLATSLIVLPDLPRLAQPSQRAGVHESVTTALRGGGWVVCAVAVLGGLAGWPFLTYWSAYVQGDLHQSAALSSQTWSLIGFVGLAGGLCAGLLADWIGPRAALAATVSLLGIAGGVAAMRPTPISLMVAAGCFGSSFNPTYGLLAAAISKMNLGRHATTLSALVNAGLGIGTMVGEFLAARIEAVFGVLRPVYFGTAVLAVAMLGLVAVLPRSQVSR